MAEFGIENVRKASITFSLPSGDLVLVPGKNRVSEEKYKELKKNKFFTDHASPDQKQVTETGTDDEGEIVEKIVTVLVPSSLVDLGEIPGTRTNADAKAKAKTKAEAEEAEPKAKAEAEADAKAPEATKGK